MRPFSRPRCVAWAAAALLWAAPVLAVEFAPSVKIDAYGGRNYVEGSGPTYGANLAWAIAPAVKLSDKNAFIPAVIGQYRRTYDARELVGGSFLTHETLDTIVNLKWVHAAAESILVKPYLAYKSELIAESSDDKLGAGLFDHTKYSGGIEFERTGERLRSFRHLFSFYAVRFYQFRSLAAMHLGTEIGAGDNVLDFNAYDYAMALDWLPWDRGLLTWAVTGSFRHFSDQKVVTKTGAFTDSDKVRQDIAWSGDAGLQHRGLGWRWLGIGLTPSAGFHAGFAGLLSSQDHYDAGRLKYLPRYYDYHEVVAGPFGRFRIGIVEFGASYDYARRDYTQRLAQAEDGTYRVVETVFQNTHAWTYGVSVAAGPYLTIKGQGAYLMSSSNNKFERTYRYNYRATHFFTGVGIKY